MAVLNTKAKLTITNQEYTNKKNIASNLTKINTNIDNISANTTAIANLQSNSGEVVVETYSDDTKWYRIWSDGWIEQGGYIDYPDNISATKYGDKELTFAIEFSDTKYNLQLTSNRTNCYAFEGDAENYNYTHYRTKGSTKVGFRNVNIEETSEGNKRAVWYAYGY